MVQWFQKAVSLLKAVHVCSIGVVGLKGEGGCW